ncbi:MAG: DNA mismatch repair endonuclease MutL [Candidatus Aminicenantes bacterium]|jgi:DNA mismatch repair protein MutL
MGKVKTLREDVYKKIAAGEVVERPLSVVKELVENSLDASADSIKIEIIEGGKQLIKVTDNGSGFDPDDIEPAFKNHSTSKISELSDFDTLTSLGFRGEALPSILEVAKIEVKTSDNNDGRGLHCVFAQGEIIQKDEIAFSRGTSILVQDLFYNFPVRKKFLKTQRTEFNQIISFLEPVALVHHDKSFELIHNHKTVFVYKKAANLKDRIYQVFGKDFLDSLQEVNFEENNYQISGFVSRLNTGISVKKHQYFFVNRRPIREKTLIAALNNTFEKFLEKSRNPVAILMLTISPQEVDVNIHPMKLEIKFENASAIYQAVKHAIESCFGVMEEFSADRTMSAHPGASAAYGSRYSSPGTFPAGGYRKPDWQHSHPGMEAQKPYSHHQQAELFSGSFLDEEDFSIIGQYKNSYILVEKNNDLLLVDQHNAQERVNFDQLKKEYQEDKVVSISPLFPVMMELSPSESAGLDDRKKELLGKIGFRLESMGGNTYDIKAFPQVLGEKNIKDAIRTVIHMNVNSKEDEADFEDQVLAEVACKSAIKVNHRLYPDQMKTIVKNLFNTSNPYFCPHKRPIIVEFTLEQIEKLLKRK